MNLDETAVTCPYCWQTLTLEIDVSAGSQTYIEDCSVCCRPIVVRLQVDEGEGTFSVDVVAEDA